MALGLSHWGMVGAGFPAIAMLFYRPLSLHSTFSVCLPLYLHSHLVCTFRLEGSCLNRSSVLPSH